MFSSKILFLCHMIRRGSSALWTIQEKEDKEKMGDGLLRVGRLTHR
jgi:hypothetical protein